MRFNPAVASEPSREGNALSSFSITTARILFQGYSGRFSVHCILNCSKLRSGGALRLRDQQRLRMPDGSSAWSQLVRPSRGQGVHSCSNAAFPRDGGCLRGLASRV